MMDEELIDLLADSAGVPRQRVANLLSTMTPAECAIAQAEAEALREDKLYAEWSSAREANPFLAAQLLNANEHRIMRARSRAAQKAGGK